VLPGRLITVAAGTIGFGVLAAGCSGSDGAIADNVIEPGITAIDNAKVLTCDQDLRTLGAAVQAYSMLEGVPPADEAALVDGHYLREGSDSWDVVDGQIVAADPQCGEAGVAPANTAVPVTAPAVTIGQIVTSTEVPLSAEQMLAQMSDERVAALGGGDCARQLTLIITAAERFVADRGTEPLTIAELTDAGYIAEPITLWQVVDEQLVGVDGSGCVNVPDASPEIECFRDAQTLDLALEAYLVEHPDATPLQSELVAAGLLAEEFDAVYLVDGVVVPTIGGPCEAVDLGV
jgi:hypothetical protein